MPLSLHAYLRHHPTEAPTVAPLQAFLRRTAAPDLYRRDNFDGHLTASAFVVDVEAGALLLIRHRALGRWLQPGGHVEPQDGSLVAAALREAGEEVGIPAAHLTLIGDAAVPLDIDTHRIPANPRKAEPAHDHHDVRWAFARTDHAALTLETAAVEEARWVGLEEAARMAPLARVIPKLRAVL